MVAIVSFKREAIYGAVREMYTAVALLPQKEFHFPTGRRACEVLGYPQHHLDVVARYFARAQFLGNQLL